MGSEFEAAGGVGDGAAPTVLCPQGHTNAWNYKFCAQCGSPIGLVAWPDDHSGVEIDARPRRRRIVVATVSLVVVMAAIAAVGYLVIRSPSDDGAAPSTRGGFGDGTQTLASVIPPCGQAPVVEAESVDMTADGLTVSATFMSRCAGGNTESGSQVRITVADGERDIAAGSFDFASAPMRMDPGVAVHRSLVFPAGSFWRTTDMFSGAPQLVFHPGGQSKSSASPSSSDTLTALSPADPEHGSIEGVAKAVLKELRDADYSFVSGSIANRWIAQISSKKAGIVVDGKTLTSADVLRNHLDLRRKYSGARLLSSGQWTTFSSPDWWVTVAGPPQLTATAANGWCDSKGFGADDCFAKFVSSVFAVDGTTEYRK
jgi:hypothetical protein